MNTGEVIALIKAFGGSGGGSSGGGVLVVTDTDGTLDKTWQEIHDAYYSVLKKATVIPIGDVIEYAAISGISHLSDSYMLSYGSDEYAADSANSFPVSTGGQ